MSKEELKKLSIVKLRKKEKNVKTLAYIFVPVILGLLYASFDDYIGGGEIDSSLSIIAICSIGGFVSLLPELKNINEELKSRS